MSRCRIVTVGEQSGTALAPLLKTMAKQGCGHAEAQRPEDLPRLIPAEEPVVVLVYDDGASGQGRRALLALHRSGKLAPVIVVAKQNNFEFYYELMCDGAYDCYAIDEGWQVIQEAARWAALTRAISPGDRSRREFAAVA